MLQECTLIITVPNIIYNNIKEQKWCKLFMTLCYLVLPWNLLVLYLQTLLLLKPVQMHPSTAIAVGIKITILQIKRIKMRIQKPRVRCAEISWRKVPALMVINVNSLMGWASFVVTQKDKCYIKLGHVTHFWRIVSACMVLAAISCTKTRRRKKLAPWTYSDSTGKYYVEEI